ncbi:MAG: hypothetical protein LM590_04170 [Thermofilum sp.]|nr:hypothetical protein [Thermofilum sp.]
MDKDMMSDGAGKISRQELINTVVIMLPGVVSSVFTFIPIENFLSAYSVPSAFVWYRVWRAAFAALLLWIFSGVVYSEKHYALKLFFLGSAVSFVVFHYWFLWSISRLVAVRLYPLFYFVGENSPLFLDMGQVVALITAYAFRGEIAGFLRKEQR